LEISDWTVQFEISNFGFEMQDSSSFKISALTNLSVYFLFG